MAKKGFRWEVAAISAVLTLALFSLGYFVYESVGVRKPLEKALLADPDVVSVDMRRPQGATVIEVKLSRVDDFPATYSRLHQLVNDKLGAKETLEVKDGRDKDLEEAYHSIHYYLEEASVRGNFGEMVESSQKTLEGKGLDTFRVTVDKDRIYVQMTKGDAYFYEVLSRAAPGAGGE